MALKITKFRDVRKNTLRGFLSVRMENIGLEIRDISIHEKNGSQWLAMPSRPYEDSRGNRKYSFILDWFNNEKKAQFESSVMALIREGNYEKSR
jgi:DNA-binding cell septation regulator SpoVG